MAGDLLRRAGFFAWCRGLYEHVVGAYQTARTAAEEPAAWGLWFFELAESAYEFAGRFGGP